MARVLKIEIALSDRHDSMDALDRRDDVVDALCAIGFRLELTVDGSDVFMSEES